MTLHIRMYIWNKKHWTNSNQFIRSSISLNALKQDTSLLKVWRNVISPHCNCPQPNCNQRERYRSPDGKCNNVKHPKWGSTFTPQHRYLPPAYHDGKFVIWIMNFFSVIWNFCNVNLYSHEQPSCSNIHVHNKTQWLK